MQQIRGSVINSMIKGRNHFCCLCFKTVADSAIHIEDNVFVKKHDKTYDEICMSDILRKILGPEINDQLSIFNAVCNQCSSEAIKSYKFFSKCKDNLQKLGQIIEGLTNGTETCLANYKGSKAGFVSINTENFEYKGYNSKSTSNTSLLAYQKFLGLKRKDIPITKPATETILKPKSTIEKCKVIRLRLDRLNPKVLNNNTVFVCPICDLFYVRRYSMHKHLKIIHNISRKEMNEAKERKCLISSPSAIKTKDCVNLTSLDYTITSNDRHLHVLKNISDNKRFVDHTFRTNYLDKNTGNFSRKVPLILRRSKQVLNKTNQAQTQH